MQVTKRTYYTMSECEIDLNQLVESDPKSQKLIQLINFKYDSNWIVYADQVLKYGIEGPEPTPPVDKIERWVKLFKYTYTTTADRYIKIIELFETNEAKLLDKITNKTTNRFNDTPQQIGDYESDQYATTIATSTSEIAGAELVDRLDNIRSKLRDEFDNWVNEFSGLFGSSII